MSCHAAFAAGMIRCERTLFAGGCRRRRCLRRRRLRRGYDKLAEDAAAIFRHITPAASEPRLMISPRQLSRLSPMPSRVRRAAEDAASYVTTFDTRRQRHTRCHITTMRNVVAYADYAAISCRSVKSRFRSG